MWNETSCELFLDEFFLEMLVQVTQNATQCSSLEQKNVHGFGITRVYFLKRCWVFKGY